MDLWRNNNKMVIAGATGGIGSKLASHYAAVKYDPRKDKYPEGHSIFINCIGVTHDAMAHNAEPSLWEEVIRVNLIDAFRITQFAIRDMRRMEGGKIIHLSSMLSSVTVLGTSAYSASKAGLNAMVRVIAAENLSKNIFINTLSLGYIDAGMTHKIGKKGANIGEVIRACDLLIESDLITGKNLQIW